MDQPTPNPPAPSSPMQGNERVMSIASLVIGIISLCAWLLPICGIPLGLVGIVLAYFGMKDVSQKNLALAGVVLSGIGLLLACGNGVLGTLLGPRIGDVFSSINSSLQP